MKFSTAIIHREKDRERIPLINKVREYLPDSRVVGAFEPNWELMQDVRAIRGVSVSQLKAYTLFGDDTQCHLNLEDDAVVVPAGLQELQDLDELPEDCGILLVGSETPNAFRSGNFYEVAAPFHGAHGVLFNTPVLSKTHFMLHAWELLSTTHMADSACCLEGLLDTAVKRVGLRIYRMDRMAFATSGGFSSRTGRAHSPRDATPMSQKEVAAQKIPYFVP